jgi:hypothetical protein
MAQDRARDRPEEPARKGFSGVRDGVVGQDQERHDEPEQNRHKAGGDGRDRLPAVKVLEGQGLIAPCGVVILRARPRRALHGKNNGHQDKGRKCNLRRSRQAAALQPRSVDRDGQCIDAEVLHGAKLVYALHQHQRNARSQRRPRQR